MPYNPKAITEDDRTFAYKMLWPGFPFSIGLLASMQFEALSILTTPFGGFVSGTLIAMAWAWSHDEFARKEIAFAANWALSFAGVVLFLQIIPIAREHEVETGLVLAALALIFHAALTYRRLRDGYFGGFGE